MSDFILFIIFIVLVGPVLFILWSIWGFMKYSLFKRRVLRYVQSTLFVMSFGDMGLREAFELILEKSEENIPTGHRRRSISTYFADLPNTDGDNKVDLFCYFLWWFVLDDGKIPEDRKFADQRIDFALANMEFNEKGSYKVISPNVLRNFHKTIDLHQGQ